MRSPDYTRIAATLPPVYQADAASYAQLDAYLGLADELGHAVIERLADLAIAAGPDALLRWPHGLPLDAGRDALLARYFAAYDRVAAWTAVTFPAGWPRDETGPARRRELLARSARLWRRRGTPRGWCDWFCLYFGVERPEQRPYLLEHFKAPPRPAPREADARRPTTAYTATLFVPGTGQFAGWDRRAEVGAFVHHYAPAHVSLRCCFVDPALLDDLLPVGELPAPGAGAAELAAYAAALATRGRDLNALLCSVVSVVDHGPGVHLYECVDAGRTEDRLGVGRLPTERST